MLSFIPSNLVVIDQNSFDAGQSSSFGKFPNQRSIEDHIRLGIINLDKHAGPTSHEIVSIVKKILQINKAGHSGTLDPNVTGILPIALLDGTKVLSTLLIAPKEYMCNMHTGKTLPFNLWEEIMQNFQGEIYQVPPLKSNVVRKLRKRHIYDLKILEVEDNNVLFRVKCQAGTYIRTLCIDIGRVSGMNAYMKELRRIKTGHFTEKTSITLHQLFDAYADYRDGMGEEKLRLLIQPIEEAVSHLPVIIARENAIDPICHGSDLTIPGVVAYTEFSPNQLVSLRSPKGELIAIGASYLSSKILKNQDTGKLFHPAKVIMKRGTYPAYKK